MFIIWEDGDDEINKALQMPKGGTLKTRDGRTLMVTGWEPRVGVDQIVTATVEVAVTRDDEEGDDMPRPTMGRLEL